MCWVAALAHAQTHDSSLEGSERDVYADAAVRSCDVATMGLFGFLSCKLDTFVVWQANGDQRRRLSDFGTTTGSRFPTRSYMPMNK